MPRLPLLIIMALAAVIGIAAADARSQMPTSAQSPPPERTPPTSAPQAASQPSDVATAAPIEDMGWPRTYSKTGVAAGEIEDGWPKVVIYQPQIDSWKDYRDMTLRAAVVVHFDEESEPVYGVIDATARTVVDEINRLVIPSDIDVSRRFPLVDAPTATRCEELLTELTPRIRDMKLSLDRVLAYVDVPEARQREVDVSLDPPPIFYANREAILVIFLGDPQFKPIENSTLQYAVNSNWDILVDPSTATSYLLYGESWLKTRDLHRGPWEPARELPQAFGDLPIGEQWSDIRDQLPGKPLDIIPRVFMSRVPAEIIVTDGDPVYESIPGIRLRAVSNTESPLFRHTGDLNFYYLAAGRWFRSKKLEGPWSAATLDLPDDFKQIPRDSEWAFVLASVPGTDEAADAVMLASVPRRAKVKVDEVDLHVTYIGGEPKFAPIDGTTIEGATNTGSAVFRCNGAYYCCENAVWFTASSAKGPWAAATIVPDAIYAIPPSYPAYNVTYATIVSESDGIVETQYTSGYDNALVTAGVLVLGAGVIAALAASDDVNWNVHMNLGGNTISSYGSGAFYDSGCGFYCRGGSAYGPYAVGGGAGAYNPSTGSWARRGAVVTSNSVVAGRSGYNARTNTYGAQVGGANRYGAWSRGVVSNGDEWAAGGRASGARGSAGWMETSGGGAIARTDSRRGGQSTVARSGDGDLYVGHDGNVYKRDSGGNWQERGSGGWNGSKSSVPAMERQAQARSRSVAASSRASSGRSSAGRGRGGGRR